MKKVIENILLISYYLFFSMVGGILTTVVLSFILLIITYPWISEPGQEIVILYMIGIGFILFIINFYINRFFLLENLSAEIFDKKFIFNKKNFILRELFKIQNGIKKSKNIDSASLYNLYKSILAKEINKDLIVVRDSKIEYPDAEIKEFTRIDLGKILKYSYFSKHDLEFKIKLDEKPAIQLLKYYTDFNISDYMYFSKLIKRYIKNLFDYIISKNDDIKWYTVLDQSDSHFQIKSTEYAINYGTIIEQITEEQYNELNNLSEEYIKKQDKFKLDYYINKFK